MRCGFQHEAPTAARYYHACKLIGQYNSVAYLSLKDSEQYGRVYLPIHKGGKSQQSLSASHVHEYTVILNKRTSRDIYLEG